MKIREFKLRILTLFFIFILISTTVTVSGGDTTINDTIYVDDDNTTGPWDGSIDHPYQHIQDGVDNADYGYSVYVFNGTYYENVNITKSIDLIGEDKSNTIIDADFDGNCITVFEDNVNISGFTIQNSGDWGDAENSTGILVFSNNTCISDNLIVANTYGIWVGYYEYIIENNIISKNIVDDNSYGIVVFYATNSQINENTIINSGFFGIYLTDSNHITIHNNFLTKNTAFTILLLGSSNNFITDNQIINNSYDGIKLSYGSSNNTITGNIIEENVFHGIYIGYWFDDPTSGQNNNNIISLNHIAYNNYGLYIEGSCDNEVSFNNFILNIVNVFFVTPFKCRNIWKYNYWNRPRVIPKIIHGQKMIDPYGQIKIPWFAFDLMPAKKPYDIV